MIDRDLQELVKSEDFLFIATRSKNGNLVLRNADKVGKLQFMKREEALELIKD